MKQIVGSTLKDSKEVDSSLITNYESDRSAAEYAKLYKHDRLTGGHVVMLGADPLSKSAAIEALHAYPGKSGWEVISSDAYYFVMRWHFIMSKCFTNTVSLQKSKRKHGLKIILFLFLLIILRCI